MKNSVVSVGIEALQVVSEAGVIFPIHFPDGRIQHADGTIDHPDGTVELNGHFFDINWEELDPAEGSSETEEIPHELVMAEMCQLLELPVGSL